MSEVDNGEFVEKNIIEIDGAEQHLADSEIDRINQATEKSVDFKYVTLYDLGDTSISGRLVNYWETAKAYTATKFTMATIAIGNKISSGDTEKDKARRRTIMGIGIAVVGLLALRYGISKINTENAQAFSEAAGNANTVPMANPNKTTSILDQNGLFDFQPSGTPSKADTLNSTPELLSGGSSGGDNGLSLDDSSSLQDNNSDRGSGPSDTIVDNNNSASGNGNSNNNTDAANNPLDSNRHNLTHTQKQLINAPGKYPFGRYEHVFGTNMAGSEIFKDVDSCIKKGIKVIEHGSRNQPSTWWLEVPTKSGGMTSATNKVVEVLATKSV